MNRFVGAVLALAAVIHITPGFGVLGSSALGSLYGVNVGDPNIELLLRHRAVLFGILGLGFAAAAARHEWRTVGLTVAIVSTVSFIVLAVVTPDRTVQVDRVILVDGVLVVLLIVAAAVHIRAKREN